jgi:tRNA splicing endonuclease
MATPDLSFIYDENEKNMICGAMVAITQLELWDWLKNYSTVSFMFQSNSNIDLIYRKIESNGYTGHSGTSFGCTMRNMEYIAKNGFDTFRNNYINNISNKPYKPCILAQ